MPNDAKIVSFGTVSGMVLRNLLYPSGNWSLVS